MHDSCRMLQMPVAFDPVVMLQKERFDHRGEFHIQVEDINRECDDEESGTDQQQYAEKLKRFFHSRLLLP